MSQQAQQEQENTSATEMNISHIRDMLEDSAHQGGTRE